MKTASKRLLLIRGIAALFLAEPTLAAQRSFLMGTSLFADNFQFSFENLQDKELLEVQDDDNLGIPWTQFQNGTQLPQAWVSRWTEIRNGAASSGKVIYLAVNPLDTARQKLAGTVDAKGVMTEGWAPTDGNGCYTFATDANAASYKQAFINYSRYLIDSFHPTYFTPALEVSMQFTRCPQEKTAYIQWTSDIYRSLKQTYPNLIIFPTFQAETMYGLWEESAWCGGTKTDATMAACFQQRLNESIAIPADRFAFTFYPWAWKYPPSAPDTYTLQVPYGDMFQRISQSTTRKVWVSESGWPAVQVYTSYQHTSPPSSCSGVVGLPVPQVAGEVNQATHMQNLLSQAQTHGLEAVIWWEQRDIFDAATAAVCPCPGTNDTCTWAEQVYQTGGSPTETTDRALTNMGLRYHDGTPRSAIYNIWASYLNKPYSPVPGSDPNTLGQIQIYPNPMRPFLGHTGINFIQLPPGARLRIYTLVGEKVNDLMADALGRATWTGTNQSGQKAASGVYIVYVQSGGDSKTLKVAIQR